MWFLCMAGGWGVEVEGHDYGNAPDFDLDNARARPCGHDPGHHNDARSKESSRCSVTKSPRASRASALDT